MKIDKQSLLLGLVVGLVLGGVAINMLSTNKIKPLLSRADSCAQECASWFFECKEQNRSLEGRLACGRQVEMCYAACARELEIQ